MKVTKIKKKHYGKPKRTLLLIDGCGWDRRIMNLHVGFLWYGFIHNWTCRNLLPKRDTMRLVVKKRLFCYDYSSSQGHEQHLSSVASSWQIRCSVYICRAHSLVQSVIYVVKELRQKRYVLRNAALRDCYRDSTKATVCQAPKLYEVCRKQACCNFYWLCRFTKAIHHYTLRRNMTMFYCFVALGGLRDILITSIRLTLASIYMHSQII